uniref:hypothetical protein n=1 Tax=Kineococcus gypseus TaxID=1637102 RepID=UPI003D7EE3D9
ARPAPPDPAPGTARTSVVACGVPPVFAHGLTAAVAQHGMDGACVRDLAEVRAHLDALQDEAEESGAARRRDGRAGVVVVTPLAAARETALLLAGRSGPAVALTVLLDDSEPASYVAGLRAGARGVVPAGAPLSTLVAVLSAAARGFTVLPPAVARGLCVPLARTTPCEVPSEERGWLRQLARGVSVAELAVRTSYSEREMYRLLNRAYQRLGVSNRTEALLAAQRAGLLAP